MAKLYDANRLRKNYPLIRVKPVYKQYLTVDEIIGAGGIEVEVAIIDFINSSSESYEFTGNYTDIPVVALTPEDENVNVFITGITTSILTIESSSEFTGKVHIHVYKGN